MADPGAMADLGPLLTLPGDLEGEYWDSARVQARLHAQDQLGLLSSLAMHVLLIALQKFNE